MQTSWNCGQHLVEEECEFIKPILDELECAGADMLSPSRILLFDLLDDPDDIDESLGDTPDQPDLAHTSSEDAEIWVEVEDSLGELENNDEAAQVRDSELTH